MFCPPRLCFIKSLPPMLHPTGLPGVSCQQGVSIPPKSCVNKLHEIAFTDYPTNIYPWSCSKLTRSKNASVALVVYWMSVYLHRASGHLKLQGRINKVSSFKNRGGMSRTTFISAPQGAPPGQRKQWDLQKNMNTKQLLQSLTCTPPLTAHSTAICSSSDMCIMHISIQQKTTLSLCTHCFLFFLIYLFSSSAYTQCNSVVCVCVCFEICCYDQDLQAKKKKKFSLFLFPPPVSRSRCCSHSSLCLCYRSNW